MTFMGNSLPVQWLRLLASNARGTGSIPDRGTKIPQAAHPVAKNLKKDIYIVFILMMNVWGHPFRFWI